MTEAPLEEDSLEACDDLERYPRCSNCEAERAPSECYRLGQGEKIRARLSVAALRSTPYTCFDATCKARGKSWRPSIPDILKKMYPMHTYKGLYRDECMFKEVRRYEERVASLRGIPWRTDDEVAESFPSLKENGGLWGLMYTDCPMFALIKKDTGL